MRRSTDFSATVRKGRRVVQPDVVIHVRKGDDDSDGPRIGLIVAKSVGTAVQRHRVARRLRHIVSGLLDELDTSARVVIRALPGSSCQNSAVLGHQVRAGLRRGGRGGNP